MDRNETLVPLDLSDAIALIEIQQQQIAELKESIEEWKKAWRLEDAALKQAEEKIAELKAEVERLRMEKSRIESMASNHVMKCRGWFGDDPIWEQYVDFLQSSRPESSEKGGPSG